MKDAEKGAGLNYGLSALRFILLSLIILISLNHAQASYPGSGSSPHPKPGNFIIVNRAYANGSYINGQPFPEISAETKITVPGDPLLKIYKVDFPDPVARGDVLTYTIHYCNEGTGPASRVLVTDLLSNHLIFLSASRGGVHTPKPLRRDVVTWDLGEVAPGEKGELTITTKVTDLLDYLTQPSAKIAICGYIYNAVFITSAEESQDKATTLTKILSTCAETYLPIKQPIVKQPIVKPPIVEPPQIELPIVEPPGIDPTVIDPTMIDSPIIDTPVVEMSVADHDHRFDRSDRGTRNQVNKVDRFGIYPPDSSQNNDYAPVDTSVAEPSIVEPSISDTSLVDKPVLETPNTETSATETEATETEATETEATETEATETEATETGVIDKPSNDAQPAESPTNEQTQPPANEQTQTQTKPSANEQTQPPTNEQTQTQTKPSANEQIQPPANEQAQIEPPLPLQSSEPPLDPFGQSEDFSPVASNPGELYLKKSAAKDSSSAGDLITYTIVLSNTGEALIEDLKIEDTLPHDIGYLKGSALLNETKWPDPVSKGEREIIWSIPSLAAGETMKITYGAVSGPDSWRSNGQSVVKAQGTSLGTDVNTHPAYCQIEIEEGLFTDQGTIIGRVTKKETDGQGISGVALYLENGNRVITDQDGKFSLPLVSTGTHVLRLDETTLPEGVILTAASNKFIGQETARLIDIIPGGLVKADFVTIENKKQEIIDDHDQQKQEEKEKEGTANPSLHSEKAPAMPSLEKLILEVNPELDFLSPQDGSLLFRNQTKVVLKAPLWAKVELLVNNKPVSEQKIGRRLSREASQVVIYEYIGLQLEAGKENSLKVKMVDSFGQKREEKEIKVLTSGEPAYISISPAQREIPGDGVSTAILKITILDKQGQVCPYPRILTASTSAGQIIEPDLDPLEDGLQIARSEDGSATLTIRAARITGEAKVTVVAENIKETATLFFTPYLRDLFLVGFGELTLGKGRAGGDSDYLTPKNKMDDQEYFKGQGALFLKGKMPGNFFLTAAYDSEKNEGRELFSKPEPEPESEKNYPCYGDESSREFEALSQDKLYLKLEKRKSFLLWGDYHTDLNKTKLSAYTRTFNGLKTEIKEGFFSLTSHAAYTDQTQVIDSLPGRGISGYYFLTHAPVMQGSERVVIETRDRLRPDRVIERNQASKNSDYEIDYEQGTLLFTSPIPSRDTNLNPIYIIVSYESQGSGQEFTLAGGRISITPAKWFEAGFSSILEEKEADDYRLMGLDLTLKLPKAITLKSEWARSNSLFDLEHVYTPKEDTAWLVELEAKPTSPLSLSGYYRQVGDFFGNPSALEAVRGTIKYGSDMKYRLGRKTTFSGRYFDEKDELNSIEHELTSLGIEQKFQQTKLALGIERERSTDQGILTNQSILREPFALREDIPHQATSAKARIETCLFQKLTLFGEHKEDVEEHDYNLSQAGLEYQVNKISRLYLREEYSEYQARTDSRTILGGESEVAKNTTAFNESRLNNDSAGARTQSSLGLRHRLMFSQNLTGNITLEKLMTIHGQEQESEPDALSVATGLDYHPKDRTKITTRLEYRQEPKSKTHLGEVGMSSKLNPDYTISLKERLFYDRYEERGDHTNSHTLLGLAYRPLGDDRFNALSRFEWKHDTNETQDPLSITNTYLTSLQGIYQLTERIQVTGKYAGKLVKEEDWSSLTDLLAGKILFDLTSRLDLGVAYRILHSYEVGSIFQGGSVETGLRLVKNLWFSLGYSFDDFEADLTGESYQGEGPFIRLRFKVDENIFRIGKREK